MEVLRVSKRWYCIETEGGNEARIQKAEIYVSSPIVRKTRNSVLHLFPLVRFACATVLMIWYARISISSVIYACSSDKTSARLLIALIIPCMSMTMFNHARDGLQRYLLLHLPDRVE
jgi:hypothetical protein